MFLENAKKGWIEVICGSMFSGKTEELIRRLRRAQFANMKVEIYKPAIDIRYSEDEVVSHDSHSIPSTPIDSPASMLLLSSDVDVVGIDEAQFFDDTIVEVAQTLADRGIRVIAAGLDMDFTGKPFGPMPALMAVAEDVQKVHAICVKCGSIANHSHRLSSSDQLVVLGEKDTYEPLCRHCFNEAVKNSNVIYRDKSLLGTFPCDTDEFLFHEHIRNPQSDRFRYPEPAAVQDFKDSPVPHTGDIIHRDRIHNTFHFFNGKHFRKIAPDLRKIDRIARILPDHVL